MFIRAKQVIDLPTHLLRPGSLVDLPRGVAMRLVDDGSADAVEAEVAIRELSGIESRVVGKAKSANTAKSTQSR